MFIVNCGIEAGTTEAVDFSVHSGGDLPLGCSRFYLVFLAVLSCHVASSPEIPPADMALIHAAIASVSICLFSLAAASLGNLILRTLHLEMDTDAEHLLICTALGVISIEMLLFSVEVSQQIRTGCLVIVGLLCIIFLAELRLIASRCSRILKAALSGSRADHLLLLIIGSVFGIEFLTSLAPLTGSDALHYHFTTQRLILEYGFHPDFSISHSFLCGQQHLLILFGLALGSEQLAMGLIFLGGVLTAFALAILASRWSSTRTALIITLLFLLTPIVFWQISSSGAPDIWMALCASAAVLVLCQTKVSGKWQQVLLVGFLTGGVAGAKYTGCLVAAAIAVATMIEYRSMQSALLVGAGSLLTGIWPYMRNFVWTGDPVFPFLSKVLIPERVNLVALNALLADTGASHANHWGQIVPFVFFAAMRRGSVGFWDFFGPIVFALAPLLIFVSGSDRKWRVPAFVWGFSALLIFYASGLPRFLLAVFPLGLACTAAGIDSCQQKDWRIANLFAKGLVALLCLTYGAGLVMYSRKPVATALGIIPEVRYLEERRPEYQEAEAINHALGSQAGDGKTLLFLRHMYSLNVPFLNGDPVTSWMINPDHLRTPLDWRVFLQQEGIAYVVRSPKYPTAIEAPLAEMEAKGDLTPFAEFVVQDFQGMRMEENRIDVPVRILRVKAFDGPKSQNKH